MYRFLRLLVLLLLCASVAGAADVIVTTTGTIPNLAGLPPAARAAIALTFVHLGGS
jgi:hypothetical protein